MGLTYRIRRETYFFVQFSLFFFSCETGVAAIAATPVSPLKVQPLERGEGGISLESILLPIETFYYTSLYYSLLPRRIHVHVGKETHFQRRTIDFGYYCRCIILASPAKPCKTPGLPSNAWLRFELRPRQLLHQSQRGWWHLWY